MKKYILSALTLMAAGLQTMWAQKVLIYKTDSQTMEYEVSELDSIVFVPKEQMPSYLTCPDDNHPHAIDLGLPSGTKWACCNVGASAPEEYGGYYAWGETWEKDVYDWNTYIYGNSNTNTSFDFSHDVARVLMGTPWYMPLAIQFRELLSNCSQQWTQLKGVNGILITGPNGGQIFLPAAGYRIGEGLKKNGSYGDYWSSSLSPYGSFCAYDLYFHSEGWALGEWGNGSGGRSVHAVCP